MNRLKRALLVGLGVAALAVPAGALAGQGESHGKSDEHAKGGKEKGHGKGKGQAQRGKVGYVFKGYYAGEGKVDVKRGNHHVRKAGLIDETVEFDLTGARFVVRDVNEDGSRNADDVAEGDWVLVKTRLPRKDPGSQPFEAKRLIDKTSFRGDDGKGEEGSA